MCLFFHFDFTACPQWVYFGIHRLSFAGNMSVKIFNMNISSRNIVQYIN